MGEHSTKSIECNDVELDSFEILMDINEMNIKTLKSALQALVPHENLSNYEVWLQDF